MATVASTAMATSKSKRAAFWGGDAGAVWPAIDAGVNNTMKGIRVVQTIIASTQQSGMTVPDERLDAEGNSGPDGLSFVEGLTKPFVELAAEFSLSNGQVLDPSGSAATRLAKFAARDLAIAEDLVFLQGGKARLPTTVRIESGREALGNGLLGMVMDKHRVVVGGAERKGRDKDKPVEHVGVAVLNAIMTGIGLLVDASQSGPYYLVEDMVAYAATFGTVVDGNPTNTVITPALLGGSISPSAAMPPSTGLLIATGGDPTMFYVDTDPITEPTQQGSAGRYFFRTYERVQCVASDPRAFVVLDFKALSKT